MIFKSVSKIEDKKEKTFFIELTQIYRRLVEVFCEKNHLELKADESENYIHELTEIGVIEHKDECPELKRVLGKDYKKFSEAVNFVIANRKDTGDLLDKLYNSKRRKCQENALQKHTLTLVDFFCGAGGLSLGFVQEGFHIKLANDVEDVCIRTYMYNHPELSSDKLIWGDIKDIVDHMEAYIDEPVDVVVGGPPCQGFSEANRQRIIDDPRNKLYKYFVKAVERIAPKVVVMENVKGMSKVAGQVVEDYEKLVVKKDGQKYSYKVKYEILNSQDFGVAQARERLIYIAVRSDVMEEKNITPTKIFEEIRQNCAANHKYILMDALRDIKPLEAPRIKNMNETDSDITGKKIDVNAYEKNDNAYLKLINMGRDIPYVFNHKARYCSDVNYEIYKRLEQGDDATDDKIKDIMPYAHRNHCFKDKYYKLIADRPCRTITAHLRMDCHSHIHPYQIRAITPREAARIQSFPDDYLFLGAYLKTYMQVGNAVPAMMARGIAHVIKQYLE
ncbi:MAG: DNA cytosine methyltransferase [Blautia sp.]|nr:DNA cytosine methyltransferase [Blautia sp.]